jgi:hypothetical protein
VVADVVVDVSVAVPVTPPEVVVGAAPWPPVVLVSVKVWTP